MRFDYCTKNVQNYLLQRRRRPVDSDATLDVFKGNTFYTISLKIDPCGACLHRAPECFDVDPTQEKRMRTMRTAAQRLGAEKTEIQIFSLLHAPPGADTVWPFCYMRHTWRWLQNSSRPGYLQSYYELQDPAPTLASTVSATCQ